MFENLPKRQAVWILTAVAAVQFMVSVDLSVVNVALPQVAASLGFSAVGVTWVIDAYALAFGGLLLIGGKAADRFGRKRVLVTGLALFGFACLAGGLAQRPGELVAARAVQGTGAALLAPAALALLTAAFPSGRPRVRAFGVWSAVNAAGGASGVLIGGVLSEFATWRAVMFVNVPVAVAVLGLACRVIPRQEQLDRRGPVDVLGAVLGTAGMAALVFGVVRTNEHGWMSIATLLTLAVAGGLIAAFVLVERAVARNPLVRLGLLRNRAVSGANAFNLLIGASVAASFYFMSLYLQRVQGLGPALTGVEFLPFALGVIAGSVLAVKVGHRAAPRTLMITGGLLAAAGFAWFGRISPHGSFVADVLGPSLVASVGYGLCLGPVVSTATAGVARHETGVASGLLNASRQIGAALGLAALGTAAAARTGAGGSQHELAAGYALGLMLCAALALAAVVVAVVVLPRRRPSRASLTTELKGIAMSDASHRKRPAVGSMLAGLCLTVLAAVVPYLDRAGLAAHIRAGYPRYTQEHIDSAVATYLGYLTVIGIVGSLCWIGAIWAVSTSKRWAGWAVSAVFALATIVAFTNLLIKDTSGDTGLPALIGWIGVVPCVAGLVAVVLVARAGGGAARTA